MNVDKNNQVNPYLEPLDAIVDDIIDAGDPYAYAKSREIDEYTHLKEGNEWSHTFVAGYALALAHAYTDPASHWAGQSRALKMADKTLNILIDKAVDDRWFHRQPGMGDKNIDRFTALPVLEATGILKNALPSATYERIQRKLDAVLKAQIEEYGTQTRIYPNMDAYYCLIMWHGSELLKREEYKIEYSRFLDKLQNAQFADGGWTYISGTNECPAYHDINLSLMARLAVLSGSEQAMEMVKKSVPYYPLVIDSSGTAEYHTDPWWKHMWNDQNSFGADIVASLTGDGRNRWIGDILRERTLRNLLAGEKVPYILLVYAAAMWRDVAPEPVPDDTITYDKNIEGPRGRFNDWSWAASARYGSDTVIGAFAKKGPDEELTAILGVRPEIPRRPDNEMDDGMERLALGMMPQDTKGTTTITDESATFDVTYGMSNHRTIWLEPPFPLEWECSQHWTMDSQSLTGRMEITSLATQESYPPKIRIRLGRGKSVETKGNNTFSYDCFTIQGSGEKFPVCRIEESKIMVCRKVRDAWDIVFSTGNGKRNHKKGEKFAFSIKINIK